MSHSLCRTIAALALLAGVPAAGLASETPKPDAFVVRFLGKDPSAQKAAACFVRVYDAAHLAQHPKQKVTAMMLLVSGEPDKETKTISYSFKMGVKLRGGSTRFESAGECHHALTAEDQAGTTFACGVDCDGGGFAVSLSDDSKAALLKLDYSVAIWQRGKDDGPDRKALEAGEDDHSFQLNRASLADCVPLAEDKKEAAALKVGY